MNSQNAARQIAELLTFLESEGVAVFAPTIKVRTADGNAEEVRVTPGWTSEDPWLVDDKDVTTLTARPRRSSGELIAEIRKADPEGNLKVAFVHDLNEENTTVVTAVEKHRVPGTEHSFVALY